MHPVADTLPETQVLFHGLRSVAARLATGRRQRGAKLSEQREPARYGRRHGNCVAQAGDSLLQSLPKVVRLVWRDHWETIRESDCSIVTH